MHPTSFSPTVLLDNDAKQLARQIAMKQLTPQAAKWTYLKILAVLALYQHLMEQQKVEVILEESDSWDTYSNLIIFVPGVGRIECLPVLPGNQQCLLPDEIVADRIYVAVQFHEVPELVELLGLIPASDVNISDLESEQYPLSALKPLDDFIKILLNTSSATNSLHENLVDLSNWFNGVFDKVWRPVEVLLGLQEIETYDFKPGATGSYKTASAGFCEEAPTEIDRGMLIDLGKDWGQVVLRLSLQNQSNEELYVLVEVRPSTPEELLPANLEVAVIVGEEVLKNKLQEPGKCLQVEPDCFKYGDSFDIQLTIDEVKIIKSFIFSLENIEDISNEKT